MDVSRDNNSSGGDFRRRVEELLARDYARCRNKFIGWAVGWVRTALGKRISEHELVDLYHDAIMIMLRKIDTGSLTELTAAPCTFLIGVGKFIIPAYLRRRDQTDLPGDEHLGREEEIELGPEAKLMLAALWDEVEALEEPGRTLLYLTYKLGLSSREIAELMGYASEDVVRQLRHRHMQELRFWHFANQMDEPCRTILYLSRKGKMNDKEIAKKMGLANEEEARQQREHCLGNMKK